MVGGSINPVHSDRSKLGIDRGGSKSKWRTTRVGLCLVSYRTTFGFLVLDPHPLWQQS